MKLNREVLQMALVGLQHARTEIDQKIAEVQALLASSSNSVPSGRGVRRPISAEGRKRIAAAQRKRWAAFHRRQVR